MAKRDETAVNPPFPSVPRDGLGFPRRLRDASSSHTLAATTNADGDLAGHQWCQACERQAAERRPTGGATGDLA